MDEKYKLYLGDTRKVVAEMVERGELVDMIFTLNKMNAIEKGLKLTTETQRTQRKILFCLRG